MPSTFYSTLLWYYFKARSLRLNGWDEKSYAKRSAGSTKFRQARTCILHKSAPKSCICALVTNTPNKQRDRQTANGRGRGRERETGRQRDRETARHTRVWCKMLGKSNNNRQTHWGINTKQTDNSNNNWTKNGHMQSVCCSSRRRQSRQRQGQRSKRKIRVAIVAIVAFVAYSIQGKWARRGAGRYHLKILKHTHTHTLIHTRARQLQRHVDMCSQVAAGMAERVEPNRSQATKRLIFQIYIYIHLHISTHISKTIHVFWVGLGSWILSRQNFC